MANDWGKPIGTIIGEELETLKQRIVANLQASGQVATGKTIRSLFVQKRADGGALVFKGQMPFGVMETGRKGGKVPYGFSGIIYDWMMAKGIHSDKVKPYKTNRLHKYSDQERADRSMASAIAHTIARAGTELHRKGGRSDIYSNEIPRTIANVRKKMLALMSAEVKTIKLNNKGGLIK